MSSIRQDWGFSEVEALYSKPILDLIYEAATVHRKYHNPKEVQLCTLLSIKTGGCPENCSYCPQSAHYKTGLEKEKLMEVPEVLKAAEKAKENGSTRFCMGAAWREVKDNHEFESVLEMVSAVGNLGLEVCCTLGMLTLSQARRLKEAGLTAYNHNFDTSEEHYEKIIQTRRFQDRVQTVQNVAAANISVCCGGIIGMGESEEDRIKLLQTLANLNPQPESVPINKLVPVDGTPLEGIDVLEPMEWVRSIAVARVLMPKAKVRLSAGRLSLSQEIQGLAFLAGANSIFTGDKLLTTSNPSEDVDRKMLHSFGLQPQAPNPTVTAHGLSS